MTGPISSDRGAVRRRSAALGAVIGLVAGLVLVLLRADTFNLSLPVLAAVALGGVGAALGPAVAERMPLAALAVAFATYAVGVLLFPVAWIAITVVAGAGRLADPRLLGGMDEFFALYRLAPVGFVYALPTVPGVLAAAAVHAVAVRRLAPLPRQVDEHARRTFLRLTAVGVAFVLGTGAIGFTMLGQIVGGIGD